MKNQMFLSSLVKKATGLLLILFSVPLLNAQTTLTEAIDFTAFDVDGREWNLFELLDGGQYVCLDFSKTGCVLSQEDVPTVNEAFEHFGCNDFDVVFLGINTGNTVAEVQDYIGEFGIEIPYISGINGEEILTIYEDYNIAACPTQILIAPDHSIVEQDVWSYAGEVVLIPVLESHGLSQNSCLVGINEYRDLDLKIFPNPAGAFVEVQFNTPKNAGELKFEIFNIRGSLQKSIVTSANPIKVNISDLAEGMYILMLSSEVSRFPVKRFLISR